MAHDRGRRSATDERFGWARARRGASVPGVLASGGQPLEESGLRRVRRALRRGVVGIAVGGAGLSVLLFATEALAGVATLAVGGAGVAAFLTGYAALVRGVARSYRALPGTVPPVELAASTLPSGAGLGVLAALSVSAPFGTARTLSLLAVGTGALALVTGLGLAFVCARAATRQARPAAGDRSPTVRRGSTHTDD